MEKEKKILEKITFPDFITIEKQNEILNAIKSEKVIIIKGKPGPTGKTTVSEILKNFGVVAFEKWECVEIEI